MNYILNTEILPFCPICRDFAYNYLGGTVPHEWSSTQLNSMCVFFSLTAVSLVIRVLFFIGLTKKILMQLSTCQPLIRGNSKGIGKYFQSHILVGLKLC